MGRAPGLAWSAYQDGEETEQETKSVLVVVACSGAVLLLFCHCSGAVLVLFWRCSGAVVELFWRSSVTLLDVLVLFWALPGAALDKTGLGCSGLG